MRVLVLLSIFILGFAGCKDTEKPVPFVRTTNEVFIANEGNFGWGEGTLSIYNPETKIVQNEVFKSQNNKALGNVLQSISQWNNAYFFVLNNSSKIVVTDTSFNQIGTISGLTSPRYMYVVNSEKAYVTDLYANAISVVNIVDFSIIKTIPFNGWSEKGVVLNNEFWCTAPESNYVYCIDIETDKLKDSIDVGFASESLVIDDEMQLWVLSKGDEIKQIAPTLTVVNPLSKQKVKTIELTGLPSNLVFAHLSNTIYFLNNGIYKMQLNRDTVPKLWVPSEGRNLYALGINPNGEDVYVSNIFDFVQKSSIYRYSAEGELLDEFKAGIIAGNFFFKN